MKPLVVAAVVLGLAASLFGGACTRGPGMGPVLQLNESDGGAGSFSWAYYTSLVADGDRVAVAWMNQNGKQNRNAMFRRSNDRGQTWSPEFALNEPDFSRTISVVPTLHMLPAENEILALWQARRNEAGQKFVLVRQSTDFGETWGDITTLNVRRQSFLPVFAQRPDGAMIVAWTDERNVFRDIYANRSLDGGKTWLEPDVLVSKLPRSEAGAPALAIGEGDEAYLVWEERPHSQKESGLPFMSTASSANMGAKWTRPEPVDTGEEPLPSPMWPQLIYNDGLLTLVWTGGITGETNRSWMWMSQSRDGGKTWDGPIEIYAGKTQAFFHMKTKGPQLYLAWHGGEDDKLGRIYWNVSDDGGKTWRAPWTAPIRLDKAPAGNALHPRIALAEDSDNVAITWQEGNTRVALSVSRDLGKTWVLNDATVMTDTAGNQLRHPQVAVSDDEAYVLWERWPDKKKHIKSFADVNKVLPKDNFVRRVDVGR
ncbi:MAG: sialidase family protein [Candidatus Binatia bacterium]|nr:sialidase family protein [Candidatus Binatia bacterium]